MKRAKQRRTSNHAQSVHAVHLRLYSSMFISSLQTQVQQFDIRKSWSVHVAEYLRLTVSLFFFRYTKMKTATNIYIFNLALADALATSTLPFQSAKYLMSTWPFGELLCKLVIAIDYYNMFTSIFTLTMMSVDRYIAVCHPVRALDFRTPFKAKIINICIWILSSAVGFPVMVMAVTRVTPAGEKKMSEKVCYLPHINCLIQFVSKFMAITQFDHT